MKELNVNDWMADEQTVHLSRMDAKRRRGVGLLGIGLIVGGLAMLALLALGLAGCATQPTKFDDALFTRTNVAMVTVNWTTNVVNVTNWVEHTAQVVQTNTVTLTNVQNQVEVQHVVVTNTVEVQTPVVTQQTNALPPGSVVQVPQLAELKPAAQAGSGFISGIAGLFGYGGIASLALSGIAHGYQGFRNRRLAAAATGASAAQQDTEQAAGVLTQNIETLLAVLQGSPQGQALMPTIKNYLMTHQTATGTIETIGGLVQQYVNEPAAQGAAASILGALRTLTTQAGPATAPATATATVRA